MRAPVAAAEVEDAAAGPADELGEQPGALAAAKTKSCWPARCAWCSSVALVERAPRALHSRPCQGPDRRVQLPLSWRPSPCRCRPAPERRRPRPSEHPRSPATSARPGSSLRALRSRGGCSIAALLTIDLCGLALGLYLALVLRELYYGERPSSGASPGTPRRSGCRSSSLITVLVFWRAACTRRASSAPVRAVVSSLVLVTVITLVFARRHGLPAHDLGLYATAFVLAAIMISAPALRATRSSRATCWRVAGVRRRAVLVGTGRTARRPAPHARPPRRDRLRVRRRHHDGDATGCRCSAASPTCSQLLERASDELIVSGGDVERARSWSSSSSRRTARREGTRRADDGGDPDAARRVRRRARACRSSSCARRSSPASTGRTKRVFDIVVSVGRRDRRPPLWLLIAVAIKLDSPGRCSTATGASASASSEFGMIKFRTMYVDGGAAAGRARGGERGVGAAVQDPGRSARDARRRDPAPHLARRGAADAERAARRDEPRRPAPAAAARLRAARGVAPQALPRAARG